MELRLQAQSTHQFVRQITMKEYLSVFTRFIGYGRLDAPLWFLGREEGLGRRPKHPGWTLQWELRQRLAWKPVMDARQAHETLQDPYWEAPRQAKAWNIMSMLARGILHHAQDWQDEKLAAQYTSGSLGRACAQTLLGDAFPLPKARISSWPYTDLFPDKKTYKAEVWPERQAMWRRLLAEYHPRIVIAYGGWWQSRRETFGTLKWEYLEGEQVLVGQISTGTRVYLTPFFGRGMLSGEEVERIIIHAAHQ
jgi:hypothetical protein